MSALDDLGSDVAERLGAGPGVDQALAQRQRLIDEFASSRKPRGWRVPLVAGGSVAVAVALSLVWIYVPSATTNAPEVLVPPGEAGLHAGMYLQAPEGRPMPVKLRHGGRLLLAPRSRARVIEASDEGVHLALEDGGIEANVPAGGNVPYLIEAGPLRIVCLTARFALQWNATQHQVEIKVAAGEVEVSGGSLGDSGVRVASGTHVTIGADGALVFHGEHDKHDDQSAAEAAAQSHEMHEAIAENVAAVAPASKEASRKTGTGAAKRAPSWRSLAEDGEYAAALRAAEHVGFSELVNRLDAADLRRLADAARVARDGDRAREALLALRERFPASRNGKVATFLLGRVATELEGNHQEAARWFATYARENPAGSLRQTADGRIIDELHKAGDRSAAKAAARRYLERYESGPYHDLARSLAE